MASVRSALKADDWKWHKVAHLGERLTWKDVEVVQAERHSSFLGTINTSNADVWGGKVKCLGK